MLDAWEIAEFVGRHNQDLDTEVLSPIMCCVQKACDKLNLFVCFEHTSTDVEVEIVWTGVLAARLQYPTRIVATRNLNNIVFETNNVETFLRWCGQFLPVDLRNWSDFVSPGA